MGDQSDAKVYRDYRDLALKGYRLRNMPTLDRDVSETGSLAISNPLNNYKLEVEKTTYDPVKISKDVIGGAPFLNVFMASGRKPPRSLLSIFISNPKGILASGGEVTPYAFSTSSGSGILVVHSAYKNRDAANPREKVFSEILFRIWYEGTRYAVGNPKTLGAEDQKRLQGLNCIIHEDIENRATKETIDVVAELLPGKLRRMQADEEVGTEAGFVMVLDAVSGDIREQEAFNAILGSENGRGVAYLLNQHSNAFAAKQVVQIRIFLNPEGGENPSVLFEIGDLRLPQKGWKPSQLPYDNDAESPVPTQGNRQDDENITSATTSQTPSGTGAGETSKRSVKPNGDFQESTSYSKRADEDESSDTNRYITYKRAVEAGNQLLQYPDRPDQPDQAEGSTLIVDTGKNYKLEFENDVAVDPSKSRSYSARELEFPKIMDRVWVDNVRRSEQLHPGQHVYDFAISFQEGVLVSREMNILADEGIPRESDISEIYFRVWYDAVRRRNKSWETLGNYAKAELLRKLVWVIIENIKDDASKLVIIEILSNIDEFKKAVKKQRRGGEPRFEELKREGGTEYIFRERGYGDGVPIVDEAFSALVGFEKGRPVAQMLGDHSDAFAIKRIGTIRLFQSGHETWDLIYELEVDGVSGIGNKIEDASLEYEEHAERGRQMRINPKPKLREDVSPAGSEIITDSGNGYKVERGKVDSVSTVLMSYRILTGRPADEERTTKIEGKTLEDYGRPEYPYEFSHSRENGILVIDSAFKRVDRSYLKEHKFSEILYRVWYHEIHRNPRDESKLAGIKHIGAHNIVNRAVGAVCNHIFGLYDEVIQREKVGEPGEEDEIQFLIFESRSQDDKLQASFDALLGTVFGRAVSRMLYDHSNALEGREIVGAVVLREGTDYLDLAFAIGEGKSVIRRRVPQQVISRWGAGEESIFNTTKWGINCEGLRGSLYSECFNRLRAAMHGHWGPVDIGDL
ncbi:hypothetical protein TWF281_005368 [Arthrobotrys megalospora]